MSIKIEKDLCTGCGKCGRVCPGNLLSQDDDGKAYIKYPEECWGCTSCLKECKFKAITYFLGADLGGKGSQLRTKQEGNLLHWIIDDSEREKIITVDKSEANAY